MADTIENPIPPTLPFIDGDYRKPASGRTTKLVNPATEDVVAEIAEADIPETVAAIESAYKTWENEWRELVPRRRSMILFEIARRIHTHSEELAQLETLNIGKPISDARKEVELAAHIFEYYAGAIDKFHGQTIPVAGGGLDITIRQPMGVVACIVPWSFPFLIACRKTAPALAAGNVVVLKPAALSPLTALKLGELACTAGLPPGALQVLPGRGCVIGDLLVTHPLVRKISFTGSTEVGRRIMELASGDLKRVSLELSGKSQNIVFAESDWQRAAELAPLNAFANAGQDSSARSRMFVERSVFEMFLDRFVNATRKLVIGDPTDPATQIGPLVSKVQRETVEELLDDARAHGSRFVYGGSRARTKGFYLEPTVLTGVRYGDRCWREEIFGPVVCLAPFDDETAMLGEANASPYGLCGSIWTTNLQRALRVARAVEWGAVSVNSYESVHPEAPFGGFKQSGLGRDLGMAGMENYTELKNVYVAG